MSQPVVYLIIGFAFGGLALWLFFRAKLTSSTSDGEQLKGLQKFFEESNTQLSVANDRLSRSEEAIKSYQTELSAEKIARLDAATKLSAVEAKHFEFIRQYEALLVERERLQNEIKQAVDSYNSSREKSIELDKENKYLKESLDKQKLEMEDIGKKFSNEFKLLADQILEDKTQRFTKMNQENLDRLLKPLGENIQQFQKQVQEVYEKESKERFSLGNEVKQLRELNQTISQEAKNLTDALKGQAKTQGNWGEMILESILEKSGLVKGREYSVQESIKDQEGKRFQPDVILSYPDNRKVIIDSKVSLVAYERYSASSTKEEQDKALLEHLRSIRSHIDSLSSKSYQDMVGSLDSVMMFIPIEPAYMVVMEADSELWNYAYSRRVLLISPTNLIAALKLIYNLWQHEFQNRNAIEIAERGGKLYDKFVGFVENLTAIGENIHKAHASYESAFSQLRDGKGNLISQAKQLKELGVKAKKTIPSELIDDNDVNDLNPQGQLPSKEQE
ncbi:MAG: DNA recombination protein RmuC [Bacteroidales bacterium]|nr:MAG: DNA recombination protein RmuC [Bacteroidales bacterium]